MRRSSANSLEQLEPRLLLAGSGIVFTVDSLLDVVAVDGVITLREAIEAANANTAVGDAPAGSGTETDVIQFSPSLMDSTIALGGTELLISDDLEITGLGSDQLTIDAGGLSRVFEVSAGVQLLLSNLAITGGQVGPGEFGGGIVAGDGSTLVLVEVWLHDNVATGGGGGIYAYNASVAVVSSLVENNQALYQSPYASKGGGVMQEYGSLLIAVSTFHQNSADYYGGAVSFGWGMLTITESVFEGNVAGAHGYAFDSGGALDIGGSATDPGIAHIDNSVFVGNQSNSGGGGIAMWRYTDVSIVNSTIAGNRSGRGGGIYNSGDLALDNTIVAGNSAVMSGPEVHNDITYGLIVAQHSLLGDASDSGVSAGNGNLLGSAGSEINPGFALDPYAGVDGNWGTSDDDYGHLWLQSFSPAVNAGDDALALDSMGLSLQHDLAGNTRVLGSAVDMGAYEYSGPVIVTIPDANLAMALRGALGLGSSDPIYDTDLAGLTGLDIGGRNIVDLTGLEYCTGLTTLNLSGNVNLTDLSPLVGLINLVELDAYSVPVTDLSPLAGLSNLDIVYFTFSRVADISPLIGLTGLSILDLQSTPLNPSAYASYIPLIESYGTWVRYDSPVSIAGMVFDDVNGNDDYDDGEPVRADRVVFFDDNSDGLLDWNDLNYNLLWEEGEGERWTITDAMGHYQFDNVYGDNPLFPDFWPLSHVLSADGLNASKTIDPAPGDVVLDANLAVYVSGVEVTVPDAALAMALRDALGLGSTDPIYDTDLAGLLDLSADGRGITDLTGLEYCTSLETLFLGGNDIVDSQLASISGLTTLFQLRLSNNQLTDAGMSHLSSLTGLEYLSLGGNAITDSGLAQLAGLTSLTGLYMANNQITSGGVTSLSGMSDLIEVDLANNQVADISPLTGLASLDMLDVRGNPLNASAYSVVIPLLEGNGVTVHYDPQATGLLEIYADRIMHRSQSWAEPDNRGSYELTFLGRDIEDIQIVTPWGETAAMNDFVPVGYDPGDASMDATRGRLNFGTSYEGYSGAHEYWFEFFYMTPAEWAATGTNAATIHVDYAGGGSWDGVVTFAGLPVPAQTPQIIAATDNQLIDSDTPAFAWKPWTGFGPASQIDVRIEDLEGDDGWSPMTDVWDTLDVGSNTWTSTESLPLWPCYFSVGFTNADSADVSGVTVSRRAVSMSGVNFVPGPGQYDDVGNTPASAKPVLVGSETDASLDYSGDFDVFKFAAVRGRTYDINVSFSDELDTVAALLGPDGDTLLNFDDDSGLNWGSRLLWTAPANGVYYIVVTGSDIGWDDIGDYTLQLEQVDFAAETPTAWWNGGTVDGMLIHGGTGAAGYWPARLFGRDDFNLFVQLDLGNPLAPVVVGNLFPMADMEGIGMPATPGRVYFAEEGMAFWGEDARAEIIALDETPTGYVEAWRIQSQIGEVDGMVFANDMLFVGAQPIIDDSVAYLEIYDLSDPDSPVFLSSCFIPAITGEYCLDPEQVIISGDRVYVRHDLDGTGAAISVIDVSDPANPALLGQAVIPSDVGGDMIVQDDIVWILTGAELCAYDFADPNDPQLLSSLPLAGSPGFIHGEGDQIFIGIGQAGVTVVNIADPAVPTIGATFDVAGASGYFAMTDGYIYIPTASGRTAIFARGNDLVPSFGALTLPAESVPGDGWKVPVAVNNAGAAKAAGLAEFRLWLDPNDVFGDGDEMLLGAARVKLSLEPGQTASYTPTVTLPANIQPGDYRLVGEFLPDTVVDSDVSNNIIATGPNQVVWAFGDLAGRRVPALAVADPDGTLVTFSMTGPGTGYVTANVDSMGLEICDSTLATKIHVTTKRSATPGDDGEVRFDSIYVDGSLNMFYGKTSELAGDVYVSGRLAWFLMDDVESTSTITIEDLAAVTGQTTGLPRLRNVPSYSGVNIRFDDVYNLGIYSAVPIVKMQATQWYNDPYEGLAIEAPTMGMLKVTGRRISRNPNRPLVDGDFCADVRLTNADKAGNGLGAMLVAGCVYDSLFDISYGIGTFIAGEMFDSKVLAGVDDVGLPASAADFYEDSTIGFFIINGIRGNSEPSFSGSTVAAATIGTILVREVATDNGGGQFGFASRNPIEHYYRFDGKTLVNLLRGIASSLPAEDDYVVRIV